MLNYQRVLSIIHNPFISHRFSIDISPHFPMTCEVLTPSGAPDGFRPGLAGCGGVPQSPLQWIARPGTKWLHHVALEEVYINLYIFDWTWMDMAIFSDFQHVRVMKWQRAVAGVNWFLALFLVGQVLETQVICSKCNLECGFGNRRPTGQAKTHVLGTFHFWNNLPTTLCANGLTRVIIFGFR